MTGSITLGRVFGIQISIHPSWFLILALITASLATGFLPAAFEGTPALYWAVAGAASLLLFGSVLLHELAHSLVARAQGIRVRGITLFLLGGVSSVEDEPATPGREVMVAGVGPLTSLVLGGALIVIASAVQTSSVLNVILVYLGSVNLVLGVFNLLPGLPLDGGRVLRALLWARWRDRERATAGAAEVGRWLGYALIAWGVLLALGGGLVGGLWIGFVGWTLVQSSRAAGLLAASESRLRGVPVVRLMSRPKAWVPPFVTLAAAAHDYLQANRARCLPVTGAHEGEFEGAVCLADMQKVPPQQWESARVAGIMRRRGDAVEMEPGRPAVEALRLVAAREGALVAVVKDGRLLGLVDRQSVSDYLMRAELSQRPHRGPAPPAAGGREDAGGEEPTRLAA